MRPEPAAIAQGVTKPALAWPPSLCVSGIPRAGRRRNARRPRAWRLRRHASRCRIRSYAVGDTAIVVSTPVPLSPAHVSQVSTAHLRVHPNPGDAGLEFRGRSVRPSARARKGAHYVRKGRSSAKGACAAFAPCACAHQRLEHSLEHCLRKCSRNGVSSTICSRAFRGPPDGSKPCAGRETGLLASTLARENGTSPAGYGKENT